MSDIVDIIRKFNDGRDPERLAMKYARLRASPFGFMRGTCHLFYEHLGKDELFAGLAAPTAWICGDAHLENFGSYKGDNRLAYFDLNDFDEATLAPLTWDLVRFLTAVRVAGDTLRATRDECVELCEDFLSTYAATLAGGKASWVERDTAKGFIRTLLDDLRLRTRPDFLDKRTARKGKQRAIRCDGKHALAATAKQHAQVTTMIADFACNASDPTFYEVIDVARRIAGTGSLGVDRFIVLVRGKGSPDGNYLLDLKQALPSAPQRRARQKQPTWGSEASRVVTLQKRLQAVPMAFLHAMDWQGDSYILRGLQPSEDRISLCAPTATLFGIREAICTMATIVASAHLRAAGRQGSAIADELVAFGASASSWAKPLLATGQSAAQRVESDWKTYASAFDQSAFG